MQNKSKVGTERVKNKKAKYEQRIANNIFLNKMLKKYIF